MESSPASVNIADEHGLLPAHYAVMRNAFDILTVLVQQQGSTGIDLYGMQPLHYAVIWVSCDSAACIPWTQLRDRWKCQAVRLVLS